MILNKHVFNSKNVHDLGSIAIGFWREFVRIEIWPRGKRCFRSRGPKTNQNATKVRENHINGPLRTPNFAPICLKFLENISQPWAPHTSNIVSLGLSFFFSGVRLDISAPTAEFPRFSGHPVLGSGHIISLARRYMILWPHTYDHILIYSIHPTYFTFV